MKISLIVNPVASSVTKRSRIVIQKALSADHDLEVTETARRGQATRLAYQAARAGAEVVLAMGGDGTINEVANGVLDQDCAIAPIPGGSTNVFARAIGYPNEAIEATGVILESLNKKSFTQASVGLANGRAFLFHVGAGFDAAVVQKVEEKGPLKKYIGHPLFIASTFATWIKGVDRKNPWFSIKTAEGQKISAAQLAVALNCNPYTYLGNRPLDLAPEVELNSPLSLIVLTKLSVSKLVPALYKALKTTDGIPNSSATRHLTNITAATLTGYRPFPYQLDGEFLDPVDKLELEHKPDAIRIVTPVKN